MVLYTKPIGTKTKHGNIRIEISKITAEYIDAKLAEFYIKSEICYNVQDMRGRFNMPHLIRIH